MDFPYTDEVKTKLAQIKRDMGQVYLLYGSVGSGKLRAAQALTAEVLERPQTEPLEQLAHPNLTYLSPLEGKKSVSIAQVREMSEHIWQTSVSKGLQKIVIINGIDTISTEAANALLKNLEDSPPQTTFFLLASSLENVLPTIRSRSQLVFFAPISHTLLTQYLETEYQVSSQQAEEITQLAHGLPEEAIALLDNDKLELRKNLQRDTQIFISGTITQRFAVAKTVHEQKIASQFVSELSYAIWQQSSILMHGESDSQNSISNLEKVLQAQAQLLANVSSRTTLENLALQLEHN